MASAGLSWKHWRQSTGRPWVGLNGTVVSMPQAEHSVRVSVRGRLAAVVSGPERTDKPARFPLQGLHRFGSFLNCLSKKNSCSPAVKMNSPPQSVQVRSRSRNSMSLLRFYGKRMNAYIIGARSKERTVWLTVVFGAGPQNAAITTNLVATKSLMPPDILGGNVPLTHRYSTHRHSFLNGRLSNHQETAISVRALN